MIITRVIHPIGQGGFYTETLNNGSQEINVVYDCGGFDRYGQKKMQKYLDSYLGGNKKEIEAVFISHFHADHINGLQYLLDNAKVKYLIIPELTVDVILEAFVYNAMTNKKSDVNNLLSNLYGKEVYYGSDENQTRIIRVNYYDDNDIPVNLELKDLSNENISLEAWDWRGQSPCPLSELNTVPRGTILHCGKWLYIPFNSNGNKEKRSEVQEKLKEAFGENLSISKLPELLKTNSAKKKCKKIYESVFNNQHNSYSMTLFSGVRNSHCFLRPDGTCCKRIAYCGDCNPNFLYTGDFEPKNNNCLQDFYGALWQRVASVQVPHHGSKDNLDKSLYEFPYRGIISVGKDNTYNHPSIDVLNEMEKLGCMPVIVTEDEYSKRIYQYVY